MGNDHRTQSPNTFAAFMDEALLRNGIMDAQSFALFSLYANDKFVKGRKNEGRLSCTDVGYHCRLTTMRVVVQPTMIEHKVRVQDFLEWLERKGGSPAAVAQRNKLSKIVAYELQRTGKAKRPYCFEVREGSLFAFAGRWERKDGDGKAVETCSILTRTPNAVTSVIHRHPRF